MCPHGDLIVMMAAVDKKFFAALLIKNTFTNDNTIQPHQ
jgi:hypothetical protein